MADNTPTKKTKNSHFGCFLASLVGAQLFNSVECHYLQTDHTHNELDQRFSTMACCIKQAEVLEDIQDLVDYLRAHMSAACGRDLIIEEISNTMDFKSWFGDVNLHMQGLTSTHLEPQVNHLWRFLPRYGLPTDSEEIECHHSGWKQLQEHPHDVILVVKQFMSSPHASQKPQLCLPASLLESLDPEKLQPSVSNALSETVLQEFRRTAESVSKAPWNLLKAQVFLETLCEDNEKNVVYPGMKLQFIFSKHGDAGQLAFVVSDAVAAASENAESGLEAAAPAPAPPRIIRVVAKSKAKAKAAMKRPSCRMRPAACLPSPGAIAEHSSEPAAPVDAGVAELEVDVAPTPAAPPLVRCTRKRPAADIQIVPPALSEPARPEEAAESEPEALPANFHYGCSKCRRAQFGCKECQGFLGLLGWHFLFH